MIVSFRIRKLPRKEGKVCCKTNATNHFRGEICNKRIKITLIEGIEESDATLHKRQSLRFKPTLNLLSMSVWIDSLQTRVRDNAPCTSKQTHCTERPAMNSEEITET